MGEAKKFQPNVKAIDLFCGIGGLTFGLQEAGIRVVAGIDNDPTCEYAFSTNNNSKFLKKDIRNISEEMITKLWGKSKIKILVGCAPCQTFSQHTTKIKDRHKDERWSLLNDYLELIKKTTPDIITMENVPQITKYSIFDDFVGGLKKLDYFVSYKIVYCPKYGIPQNRRRLVLLASKYGKISLIPETHEPSEYLTVEKTIGNLEPIEDGLISKKDPMHRSWKLTPINKKRMIQSKPGGSWLDWDEDIRLACHKKSSGSSYKSVYGKMRGGDPSPTITTQFFNYGTGRFGHPSQERALTLREGALLQTFPKEYAFYSNDDEIKFHVIGRHIGNAVPVKLGEVIGESILVHLREMGEIK